MTLALAVARLSSLRLSALDDHLTGLEARSDLTGAARFATEFVYFVIKQARACLFAGLFFAAVFSLPRGGLLGVPRYDLLFIWAVAIQAVMVLSKLETVDELKAITLFHVLGIGLELFKTSSAVGAWSYPDFAYLKLSGVPLFSGFTCPLI